MTNENFEEALSLKKKIDFCKEKIEYFENASFVVYKKIQENSDGCMIRLHYDNNILDIRLDWSRLAVAIEKEISEYNQAKKQYELKFDNL